MSRKSQHINNLNPCKKVDNLCSQYFANISYQATKSRLNAIEAKEE